ncbi:unnamed protein product [Meganyctiphanes norvegica]|uniref:Tetraspanin n=1 Tax=Meganyctiphanes norvegica TaxID=48144 RepID=A0AAV2PL30_MEGNR
MGCLSCINKTILYILNMFLFLFGLSIVVTTSVALSKSGQFGDLLADGTFTLPIIVLIVGVFILLLGFFGCCGAKKENPCMLYTYASVLVVLIIAQVTCAILLLVYKDTAEDFIKGGMYNGFDKYGNANDPDLKKALDKIQNDLECCGVEGPEDWKNATHLDKLSVADGCCKDMEDGCGHDYFNGPINPEEIYTDGCYDVIKEQLLGLGLGITGLILAAAGVQLAIVILACMLAKKGKKDERGHA